MSRAPSASMAKAVITPRAALRASEERLRALSEALELQVAERTAALQASEASMRGIFETIDAEGRLILRDDRGQRRTISAGDVHFGVAASARPEV